MQIYNKRTHQIANTEIVSLFECVRPFTHTMFQLTPRKCNARRAAPSISIWEVHSDASVRVDLIGIILLETKINIPFRSYMLDAVWNASISISIHNHGFCWLINSFVCGYFEQWNWSFFNSIFGQSMAFTTFSDLSFAHTILSCWNFEKKSPWKLNFSRNMAKKPHLQSLKNTNVNISISWANCAKWDTVLGRFKIVVVLH